MKNPGSLTARLSWIYRAWRYRLKVEKAEIRCLLGRVKPGQSVVDIGAHKGAYTYWMRRAVGASGRVYAFEPQPTLSQRLQALVAPERYGNVMVENYGLSSSAGTLMLKLPHVDGSPSASFEETAHTAADSLEIAVAVTTIDDYFLNGPGAGNLISLIKCDAEGHELEIFRGGEQLLRTQGPDLLFECELRHRHGPLEEVFEYLKGLGYEGWYLGVDGESPIERFDAAIYQANPDGDDYVNNFIFAHPGRNNS